MISKENMLYINNAIKIFNGLVNKTYLIGFGANRNQPLNFIEIQIGEQNFWHLVACKIDHTQNLSKSDAHTLYEKCLIGEDISDFLIYTHKSIDVKIKSSVIERVFDFIGNAKVLRIIGTENTPESYMFELGIGAGAISGLVGYSSVKNIYIPKTAQMKSIFSIDSKANNKIEMILSKNSYHRQYDTIEFESSKGLFAKLSPQLFEACKLSPNLIALIPKKSIDITSKQII